VKADWCNGNVAMTGTSYGGTLPYEVAVTGVKGLKTIIPFAGISNWYDYVNSQGIPLTYPIHYSDFLASFNSGGLFEDDDWLVPNDDYGAALWQIGTDQLEANGNYAPIWGAMDYSRDHEAINCSALIVHGLNDYNVQTKQSILMYQAFKKAGKNVKLLFHQNGHDSLYGFMVNDVLFDEVMNRWLSHYLYDIDNGIEDWPEVFVQSNIDGSYSNYEEWVSSRLISSSAENATDVSRIENGDYEKFFEDFIEPNLERELTHSS
jgi:X-Pro dipeptidyl-peptidase